MPIKRYRKKTRRSYRPRRRYGVRKRPRIPRSVGPPKYVNVKLMYTTITTSGVDPIAASSSYTHQWRLNSLFDPDYTSTGYQPYFHDQYSAMYEKYRVYACKVEMRLSVNSASTDVFAANAILAPSNDFSTTWTTVQNACNTRMAMMRQLVPNQNIVTFKKYYPIANCLGVSKRAVSIEDDYAAVVTTNPINRCILNLIISNNARSTTLGWSLEARFKFYARYYDLKDPAPS